MGGATVVDKSESHSDEKKEKTMTTPKRDPEFPPRVWVACREKENHGEPKITGWQGCSSYPICEHAEYLSLTESESIAQRRVEALKAEVERLREALAIAKPIVTAAFWDHHTAGTMPGSGYSHKVYHKVSAAFGWRNSKEFEKWEALNPPAAKGTLR